MITFVVGTRPDIIKMEPLINRVEPKFVVHTGQHYTESLDAKVQRNVGLEFDARIPVSVGLGSGGAYRDVYEGVVKVLSKNADSKGSWVCVYGDTLSALAASVAAKVSRCKVAHVEAGLRSYDLTMPEEVSRIAIDAISDRLYAPTKTQKENLVREGINEDNIMVFGNLVADSVKAHRGGDIPNGSVMKQILADNMFKSFGLMTLHRPENVNNSETLKRILEAVEIIATAMNVKHMIFPCHPAAVERVTQVATAIRSTVICPVPPVVYTEMLWLLDAAQIVLTDSGGLQEECAILGKRYVTIRRSTERPETVSAGYNCVISPFTHNFNALIRQAILHLQGPELEPSDMYAPYGSPAQLIAYDLMKEENGNGR